MALARLDLAIDGPQDRRTFGGNRVSTGTPGNRPKGMSRPREAAPSGPLTGPAVLAWDLLEVQTCVVRQKSAMSEFPGCLLVVTAEVGPAVEAERNRWYDSAHLPDALKCPGVRRGRRYVSSGEISDTSGGKTEKITKRIYTTIYEMDGPGATATPEFQAMRGWYQFAPHVRSRTQVIVPTG